MLARLLRLLLLGLLACAVATVLCLPWPWCLLALLFALPQLWFLAIEFVLRAFVGSDAGAPPAGALALLRAWWGEVLASTRVFGWQQAFAAQREWDVPGRTGRRGVVLVHGFVCNRGLWARWLRDLRAADVPAIAVSLEPVFGSIDAMVPALDAAVARLQAQTGLAPLLVAHSMGGLVIRAWMRDPLAGERMAGAITIGSPHHGTWLARMAWSTNGRQMRQDSLWLAALAAQEPRSRLERFTCFYSHCDNIVFPTGTAMLDGAANHHLPATAHLALVDHPAVFAEAMRQLRL